MKIIIAGSRRFPSLDINEYRDWKPDKIKFFEKIVYDFLITSFPCQITEIVSGMAWGIDTIALIVAKNNNIPVKPFPANWSKYGKKSGFIRNKEMGDYADGLICIHSGSNGSKHMIEYMKSLTKPVFEKVIQ